MTQQRVWPALLLLPSPAQQGDRATQLKFRSIRRPHMRAFYVSTLSFLIAFTSWFAFAPLMPEVKKDLGLTNDQVANANIAAVTATVFARAVIGPLCDTFGPRQTFAAILALGSVPTYACALVQNAWQLALVRFFVGILGATFVCNQAWATQMFATQIVGTANATSAGWGNLGGGLTHVLMAGIWEGFKTAVDSEMAWRLSFTVPATMVLLCSFATWGLADDCPHGNFKTLERHGAMARAPTRRCARAAYRDPNTWLLALHYALCFGMELTVFNVAATYFVDTFGLSVTSAALVTTLFGLLNLVSRSGGGLLSDALAARFGGGAAGMRGRLLAHVACLTAEGVCIIAFSRMATLASAITALVFFAVFVQMSNGTTYAIVPYVAPGAAGAVAGAVGAGGNTGAIVWGLIFRFGPSSQAACFTVFGVCVLGVGLLTAPLIRIRGHDGLFTRARGAEPGGCGGEA